MKIAEIILVASALLITSAYTYAKDNIV